MSTASELLSEAEALYQAGQLADAEQRCRQALAADPDNVQVHYLLGVVCHGQGKIEDAIASLAQTVQLVPGHIPAQQHLGMLLVTQGRLNEAVAHFENARRQNPISKELWDGLQTALAVKEFNQGMAHVAEQSYGEAADCFRRAVEHKPGYLQAQGNLGVALQLQGKLDEAAAAFRRAVELAPRDAESHRRLAGALEELGQRSEAIASCRRAVELQPDHAESQNSLGVLLERENRLDEARACLQRAVSLKPDFADAGNNLGSLLQKQGDLESALACFRRALAANPESADTYNNLGNVYQEMGMFDEALDCYNRSVSLQADAAEPHFNRAQILLRQQRFTEGWPEFAWRLKCRYHPTRELNHPLWDGRTFAGRTLLVHAEQGLGDTLQFVRYLPSVRKLGGKVVLEVQPGLVRLLADSGFSEAVAAGSQLPPIDLHAPLLQLPAMVHTTLENLPAEVPYLAPEADLVETWRKRLAALDGFRVGIAWQGNRQYVHDRRRSIPLREFAPLGAVAGVRLISLQKGDGSEQLAEAASQFEILDLGPQLDGGADAFIDTAAVIANLDLVISSDTAIAHLAGALAARVWVALADVPEWRWFLARADSPWYPTMRLYRQSRPGDWGEVFERIAADLAALQT